MARTIIYYKSILLKLQCGDSKLEHENIDEVTSYIQNISSIDGNQKYDRIVNVFKAVLIISYSNEMCERVFSSIK